MVSVEDMKTMIQEWIGHTLNAVDLAKTYAELKTELDIQLEYRMSDFVKEG